MIRRARLLQEPKLKCEGKCFSLSVFHCLSFLSVAACNCLRYLVDSQQDGMGSGPRD